MTEERKKIVIAIANQTDKAELANRIADKMAEHFQDMAIIPSDIDSSIFAAKLSGRLNTELDHDDEKIEFLKKQLSSTKFSFTPIPDHFKNFYKKWLEENNNDPLWEFVAFDRCTGASHGFKSLRGSQAHVYLDDPFAPNTAATEKPKPDWKQSNFYKRAKPEKKVSPLLKKLTGKIK